MDNYSIYTNQSFTDAIISTKANTHFPFEVDATPAPHLAPKKPPITEAANQ